MDADTDRFVRGLGLGCLFSLAIWAGLWTLAVAVLR